MMLQVKGNERVFPVTEGIDFLGYVIYPTHTRLRKRNKQNAARKLHKVKSKKRRQEIIASLYGQCKHANCHNLFYRLTGIKMNDFKSLGIKPKFEDGKKRFKGMSVSVRELVNIPIEVVDFETGIVPRFEREEYEKKVAEAKAVYNAALAANNGKVPAGVINPDDIEKPHGRYVVRIKVDGVEKKFFTASKEMWSILEQIREMDKFPFTTTIKAEMYGKKGETKYILLDMRRVTGNKGVLPIECVNPKKDKWRIRWDVQEHEDDSADYMEEEFDHKPTDEEIKAIVIVWYNRQTDQAILSGFEYEGNLVWLSSENQFNYKAAYDLAVQTSGATLPVTFKFGTDEQPVYRVFDTLEELTDFYVSAIRYVQETLEAGWKRKNAFDLELYKLNKLL